MAGVRAPCDFATAWVDSPLVYDSNFRAGLLLFRDLAPRNLCGALLPCACTQQFSGVRQPCAIKRGGGFPLQCVLGVAASLFYRPSLRRRRGLTHLSLDADAGTSEGAAKGKIQNRHAVNGLSRACS